MMSYAVPPSAGTNNSMMMSATPNKKRPVVTLTTPSGTPLKPKHTHFATPKNLLAAAESAELRDLEQELQLHLKKVEELRAEIAKKSTDVCKSIGAEVSDGDAAQQAAIDSTLAESLANMSLQDYDHVVTVYYDHNDANYTTMEQVGKGSYGVCHLVEHKRTGERICRKVIDLCQKDLDMEDARSECTFLNKVRHPNVLSLFDLHINPNMELSIYMEYCPWSLESLRLVRHPKGIARERLDVDTVLNACYQALHGLEYLRNVGQFMTADEDKGLRICHCDIKSDNLLVNFDGRVKISDFGLAFPLYGDDKITDEIERGSDAYMAPEVADTQPYWEACDVYSLGVSCYEMLTSKLPSGRSKATFWDKTRNMLALAIHGDEAKLDRAHRLLQAMMNPDPYARAVPAELLNNFDFFVDFNMDDSEVVMLEALRKGEELHNAYLAFKAELKARGAEEDLDVPTSSASSASSSESEEEESDSEASEDEVLTEDSDDEVLSRKNKQGTAASGDEDWESE